MKVKENTPLVKSPYMQIVTEGDKAVIWHSLFGFPKIVSRETLTFLDIFTNPSIFCSANIVAGPQLAVPNMGTDNSEEAALILPEAGKPAEDDKPLFALVIVLFCQSTEIRPFFSNWRIWCLIFCGYFSPTFLAIVRKLSLEKSIFGKSFNNLVCRSCIT